MFSLTLATAKSAPRGQEVEFPELSPEVLRRLERGPDVWLIASANHECPDHDNKFRIFVNPADRDVLDHIRYTVRWAHSIMSYTVSMPGNRRLLIPFPSDCPNGAYSPTASCQNSRREGTGRAS